MSGKKHTSPLHAGLQAPASYANLSLVNVSGLNSNLFQLTGFKIMMINFDFSNKVLIDYWIISLLRPKTW